MCVSEDEEPHAAARRRGVSLGGGLQALSSLLPSDVSGECGSRVSSGRPERSSSVAARTQNGDEAEPRSGVAPSNSPRILCASCFVGDLTRQ